MQSFLDRMQMKRSVLKRTKTRAELPAIVLYMESVPAQHKVRVLDTDGQEHLLDETVLQSHFKLVTWGQAKELLAAHWPKYAPKAAD